MQVLRDHLGEAMSAVAGFVEPKGIEYYGTPSESLLESTRVRGGNLSTKPIHLGGFTRSTSN
jgi:hypothetical protein